MHLLHTKELRLKEFITSDTPPYAIVSHTWDEEEVLFADVVKGDISSKKGFTKVDNSCKQAVKDGFEWVWIDTCCIDKSSSAELSEAINSMYKYYQRSEVCYAFLSDVDERKNLTDEMNKSKWFTRGWTLQELIAPRQLRLFGQRWIEIGTKESLVAIIGNITTIPAMILRGSTPRVENVAQRMSWASRRKTTREEDMAYCLLGLFDIYLTPLYGEGAYMAFLRLQQEILKTEHDHTIFMWVAGHDIMNQGLLASSPKAFCNHARCFQWMDGEPAGRSIVDYRSVDGPYGRVHPRRFTIKRGESQGLSTFAFGASGIQAPFLIVKQPKGASYSGDTWVCLEILDGNHAVALRLRRKLRWHIDGGQSDHGFSRTFYKGSPSFKPFLAESPISRVLKFSEILTNEHISREVISVIQRKVPEYVTRNLQFKISVSSNLTQAKVRQLVIDLLGATRGPGQTLDLKRPFQASGGSITFSQCPACGLELGGKSFSILFGTNGQFPQPWLSWGYTIGRDPESLIDYYEQCRMCSGEYFDLVTLPKHCNRDIQAFVSSEKTAEGATSVFHIQIGTVMEDGEDYDYIQNNLNSNDPRGTIGTRGPWWVTPTYFDFAVGHGDEMY
jgi:hypothetical protein